jgi:hypothetical protein
MLPVIAGLLFLALTLLPALWARAVLRRYGGARSDYPGSGGELARHLLDRHGLHHVPVESTAQGDHYDPEARAVRLAPEHHDGRSLTAVTVAAHEVGHALQHHAGYAPLRWRTRLVRIAQGAEKAGAALMLFLPLFTLLTRAPSAGLVVLLAGLASFGTAILVHLVTLPVELDASYRRALPLLASGYLPRADLRPARQILTACAFTYVAASLFSVLNLWRWLAILRRSTRIPPSQRAHQRQAGDWRVRRDIMRLFLCGNWCRRSDGGECCVGKCERKGNTWSGFCCWSVCSWGALPATPSKGRCSGRSWPSRWGCSSHATG